MKNNDIMDEDFGKEIDDTTQQFMETPWALHMLGVVIIACIASILLALTVRLDKWLVR